MSDQHEAQHEALAAAADELRESHGTLLGCLDALAWQVAAREHDRDRWLAGRDELRADLARALADVHTWRRVAERAVDRMVLAEARVERARTALAQLEQLAARGTPAAREAVAELARALGVMS